MQGRGNEIRAGRRLTRRRVAAIVEGVLLVLALIVAVSASAGGEPVCPAAPRETPMAVARSRRPSVPPPGPAALTRHQVQPTRPPTSSTDSAWSVIRRGARLALRSSSLFWLKLVALIRRSNQPSGKARGAVSGRTRAMTCVIVCALGAGAAACVIPETPDEPPCPTSGGQHVTILALATRTDVAPSLTTGGLDVLRAAAQSDDATDGAGGRSSTVGIVTADAQYSPILQLTPRRGDCTIENGGARSALIEDNLARVTATLASMAAVEPGLDLLRGIDHAVRGRQPGVLIIIGHGLSSAGALDISTIGFDDDPAVLAAQLRAAEQLPTLTGWSVQWEGLGAVSGAQAVEAGGPVLPKIIRETLQSYYMTIFAASGATSVVFDDAPMAPAPPTGDAAMPIIDIPEVRSVTGSSGETETTIPNQLLGFAGDSAVLPPGASEILDRLAADITAKHAGHPDVMVTITAYVADAPGPTDGQVLSQARAEACKAYLIAAGITIPITAVGGGIPLGETAFQNDQFSEALAAGMRRAHIAY